jgi:EAL domain-containing protein (putative c-di-GMP-specific phosphodiesterase class I)
METRVVAEGISSAPQMASIWQYGVTLVQGDMVQEPGPEMDFDFHMFAG